MTPPNPKTPPRRQCTATNRQGTRCGAHPIQGGTVCRLHGGAAPQVQAKAKQRLLEALDPAAAELVRIATNGEDDKVRVSAIKEILDRAGIPKETHVEHSGPDGGPVPITLADIRAAFQRTTREEDDE